MTGRAGKQRTNKTARDKRASRSRLGLVGAMTETLSETGDDSLAIAATLSLACRGLLPERLEGTPSGKLIELTARKLFAVKNITIDSSLLASQIATRAELSNSVTEDELAVWLEEKFQTICDDKLALNQITDPLFTGWIYQCLLLKRNNYADLRGAKSVHGLSQITQWFTPEWIANFLTDECIPNEIPSDRPFRFLDSSCGAGHILVPALRKLVDAQTKVESVEAALQHVLNQQLFGIDIDPLMAGLSAFSIYLACRDLSTQAPLPIPQIFAFSSECTLDSALPEPACHGSLLLSLQPRPHVRLYRIDDSQISTAELPEKFDAQALNPPYLSHRLLPRESADFLVKNYNASHYDLYAAFLELGIRLMAEDGRLALICQQSFLTTARYEELRRQLVDRCHISSIVQLGPGSFDSRGGEKVNNAIISLSRMRTDKPPDPHTIRAYNVVSTASKRIAEHEGVHALQNHEVDESDFLSISRMIPGFPLAGQCPGEIAYLFDLLPTISQSNCGITLTNGLFTCDNKRFVRHFSEIDKETSPTKNGFVPYDKGGGQKWFCTTPYLLEWKDDGNDIREFRAGRGQSRALPGERFYFRQGITYSYIGTKGFKARLLSPGSVFDIASSALFSDEIDLNYMLGFLNSSLIRFILGTLNPTVNFQIGDLRRIPMRKPPHDTERDVAALAMEAVDLAKEADRMNPASPAFISMLGHSELSSITPAKSVATASTDGKPNSQDAESAYKRLTERIDYINARESQIQEKIDEAVFDLYQISSTTRDIIKQNEWVVRTADPLVSTPTLQKFLSR